MTLVCHSKQFVFMKTHKTASTTVEMYFERFCVPDGAFGDSVDLHANLDALCGRPGVAWKPAWLVHNKKTPGNGSRYSLKDYYTPETERIVRREFDWLLSRLVYEP